MCLVRWVLWFSLGIALAAPFSKTLGRPVESCVWGENTLDRFAWAKDVPMVLLPVRVNEKQFLFALDTGSSLTVFDSSLTGMLGKQISRERVETPDKEMPAQLFECPAGRVGKLNLEVGTPVAAMDLRRI